ncbi:MAG: hypothetical protein JWP91_352 [Fibrobacteres bacterium]|nr:hypothetical protein [Fibrobacterota bacterium]
MPTRRIRSLTLIVLAASCGWVPAAHAARPADKPVTGAAQPKDKNTLETATQRLDRLLVRSGQLLAQPGAQSTPEAAPKLQALQDLIEKAKEALSMGNYALVISLCDQAEPLVAESYALIDRKSIQHGSAAGNDTLDKRQITKLAEKNLQRLTERFSYFSQRLEVGGNPRAAELMDKIRDLLDAAGQQIAADRASLAGPFLSQAESLFPELQRLIQENANSEKRNPSGSSRDPYKDLQPAVQAAMGRASESYRRLQNGFTRLNEQSVQTDDPRAQALRSRIQELLDRTKEALSTGQAEAAREYCSKAEGLLTDLHRSLSAAGNRLSPTAWERLRSKLDRAAEIVAASGNEKAGKILEKGQEHFDRAERNHSDGQESRAEVEMDLALKLAAKAVDIARSGSR